MYKYSGIFWSVKNNILSFAGKWIQMKIIVLSKLRQSQANIVCFLSLLVPRFYINI